MVLFCVQVPEASSLVSTRLWQQPSRKLPTALLKPRLDRVPVAREPGTPRTTKHAVLHFRPTRTTPKVRSPVRLSAGAGVFRCKSYQQQLRQQKAGHVLGPAPKRELAVSCKSYQQRHASLQLKHPAAGNLAHLSLGLVLAPRKATPSPCRKQQPAVSGKHCLHCPLVCTTSVNVI